MDSTFPTLGLGLGWRPELALLIDRHPALGFVEVIAEDINPAAPPAALERLRRRGLALIPHGVSLSLGGTEPLDPDRLSTLATLARRLDAPLVSEHLAFVRAGGIETGHLLPLPRRRDSLELLVANIRRARAALPVPLAVENIASLFEWPGAEMDEATFLTEVLIQADVGLLLDIANVYANARNHGWDAITFLERIPLGRLAYVHVAGGTERDGLYHDTHTHPIPVGVLQLLEELCARVPVPGALLEHDDDFPPDGALVEELAAIQAAIVRGNARRETSYARI